MKIEKIVSFLPSIPSALDVAQAIFTLVSYIIKHYKKDKNMRNCVIDSVIEYLQTMRD